MLTRSQEKAAVTPQEIEPDLPVCVQESPVEAWAALACYRVEALNTIVLEATGCAGISPFEGGQTTRREHSLTHQQKIGLKIY